ncbi:glycerophosphodiester phosphodiesterase [Legionella drancourtii]|uniref:glycerophosphodiester phosphodiesterase n=1 Tax=Legionella drancourtii TaxID=168933 RepID=UPI0005906531|nr:glycerophosphodiester phosphodiesterase family protein [Legionella drancourtii]
MLLSFLEKMMDTYFALIPRCQPGRELVQAAHVIAHRGAHDHAHGILENTLAAFRAAEQCGCWGIELDVQVTADQVLVVNHDLTLTRLWGHKQLISQLTFAQLRAQVPAIPTLAEVVAEFGQRLHLFIELKKPFQHEDVLVQVLHQLRAGDDYHLLTLDAPIFDTLVQVPKHALLLVAAHNNVAEFCKLSLKEHYAGVLGHYLLLTTKLARCLKAGQQLVGVGFVDSKYSLYRELNRGISWIFTNRAVRVSPYLQSLQTRTKVH